MVYRKGGKTIVGRRGLTAIMLYHAEKIKHEVFL